MRMSRIPSEPTEDSPFKIPEHREPSGFFGDFSLSKSKSKKKKKLDSLLGQLTVMFQMKTYNSIVFQNLKNFLIELNNQSPPLKKGILQKVQEAKLLTEQTLDDPDLSSQNIPKIQNLLSNLL